MAPPLIGKVEFQNSNNKTVLIVDPDSSLVQVILQSLTAPPFKIMELTNTGSLTLMDERARLDGTLGRCWLGGKSTTGMLFLRNGTTHDVIVLDAASGNIYLGGNGAKGDLFVYPAAVTDNTDGNKATIQLDGGTGDVYLRNGGKNRVLLDAVNGNIHVGGNGARRCARLFPECLRAIC
jgi:hypothetical protein